MYIFAFISILASVLSLKETKPKFCINCKFFITDNETGRFGRCSLFPKRDGKIPFLVNGIKNEDTFNFCTISRENDDMCGAEAKFYKKKIVKIKEFDF